MSEHDDEPLTIAPDGRSAAAQPAWRTDFPIDTPQDQYVARREFTKFLSVTSLAFVVGQFWIIVQNWLRRRHTAAAPRLLLGTEVQLRQRLAQEGGVAFAYPDAEQSCVLLAHPDGNTLVAYDQQCTHLSCAVVPDVGRQCLRCPCHHGLFDIANGRPLAGPPRRPLPRVHLEFLDGSVYATAVEVRTV